MAFSQSPFDSQNPVSANKISSNDSMQTTEPLSVQQYKIGRRLVTQATTSFNTNFDPNEITSHNEQMMLD